MDARAVDLATTSPAPGRDPGRRRPNLVRWAAAAVLLLAALTMVFPFVWTLSTSLQSTETLLRVPPQLIPDNPTLDAYREIARTAVRSQEAVADRRRANRGIAPFWIGGAGKALEDRKPESDSEGCQPQEQRDDPVAHREAILSILSSRVEIVPASFRRFPGPRSATRRAGCTRTEAVPLARSRFKKPRTGVGRRRLEPLFALRDLLHRN